MTALSSRTGSRCPKVRVYHRRRHRESHTETHWQEGSRPHRRRQAAETPPGDGAFLVVVACPNGQSQPHARGGRVAGMAGTPTLMGQITKEFAEGILKRS